MLYARIALTVKGKHLGKLRKALRRNTSTYVISYHEGLNPELLLSNSETSRLLTTPNAGGSSEISEAFSFHAIKELFTLLGSSIHLHKTEMEIDYIKGSKITDYSIRYHKQTMGCSVVRFFKYHDLNQTLEEVEIRRLLHKKLNGINESSNNVISESWARQILHILTPNYKTAIDTAKLLKSKQFQHLMSSTVILITVAKDPSIYLKHK